MAQVITLFTASVLTASGNEASPHSAIGSTVNVELVVGAVSGTTPSLIVAVQWSDDGINFAAVAADVFPAITAVGNAIQQFATKAQYFRLAWTVTGTTPSLATTALLYT